VGLTGSPDPKPKPQHLTGGGDLAGSGARGFGLGSTQDARDIQPVRIQRTR